VPPGEYDLAIAVYAKPRGVDLEDLRAQKVVRVTVTAEDVARGELTLPEITAPVVPSPAVGDVPALSFERADNTTGSLADFHGRWTVVQFWASWCNRSTQELPALRQLQERFAARKLNLLGLSLEENRSAWEEALKRLDLSWPRGRVAADGGGVGAPFLPEYWLLDPAGKIVAKVHQIDELDKLLAERLK
jgi:thiol-disulfide isomerase/thioredoxin